MKMKREYLTLYAKTDMQNADNNASRLGYFGLMGRFALASNEGSDEPAHLRDLVRLLTTHKNNVMEKTDYISA